MALAFGRFQLQVFAALLEGRFNRPALSVTLHDLLRPHGDVCAKAEFEGPFESEYLNGKIVKWSLKVSYKGTNQYAPCEKTVYFEHDSYYTIYN